MKKAKVVACGVTADNRPNVILENENLDKNPYWYHTTFYKVDAALDFLKELYSDGIAQSDIDEGLWLTLQELQEGR